MFKQISFFTCLTTLCFARFIIPDNLLERLNTYNEKKPLQKLGPNVYKEVKGKSFAVYTKKYQELSEEDLKWDQEIYYKYIRSKSIVIDIGAGFGLNSIHMSSYSRRGFVLAFEPNFEAFQELQYNVKVNKKENIICCRAALSDYEKNEITNEDPEEEIEHNAPIIPLDKLKIANISFMRIDVRNQEINILRGAKKTIKKEKPVILIRVYPSDGINLPDYGGPKLEVKEYIKKLGYYVHDCENGKLLCVPLMY